MLQEKRERGRKHIWRNNSWTLPWPREWSRHPDAGIPEISKWDLEQHLKRQTPKHIIIKLSKVKHKEIILKEAREKQLVIYKGTPIRPSADFLVENFQAIRKWNDIFKIWREKKKKNFQSRILYPEKLSFGIKER